MAEATPGTRYLSIDVHEETGKLRVDRLDSSREDAVEEIILCTSKPTSIPAADSAGGKAADDSLSELSDVEMEDVDDVTATAAAQDQGEQAEAETSIAQRMKRSSRNSKPVSYAENDKDDEDSDSDAELIGVAASFIVTIDGMPTVVSKEERQKRILSAKLWLQHLKRLRLPLKDAAMAVGLAIPNAYPYYVQARDHDYSITDQELRTMLQPMAIILRALKTAKPAAPEQPIIAELDSLYEEIDGAESKESAALIKSLVSRKVKGKKIPKRERRRAFQTSAFGTRPRRPWRADDLKRMLDKMKPLSDEVSSSAVVSVETGSLTFSLNQDSDDENFEASLAPSDKDGSSTSSESESESESEASPAEPARKRFRLGKKTASKRTKPSKSKSKSSGASKSKQSKADKNSMQSKLRDLARKRARSQNSEEEEVSEASDSGAEASAEAVAAFSKSKVRDSFKMQGMASGSSSNSASSSSTANEAEPEESTHPGEQAWLHLISFSADTPSSLHPQSTATTSS